MKFGHWRRVFFAARRAAPDRLRLAGCLANADFEARFDFRSDVARVDVADFVRGFPVLLQLSAFVVFATDGIALEAPACAA